MYLSCRNFDAGTPDKPEIWDIARTLGIDPDAVVGKCLKVWAWFDQHTENGHAPVTVSSLLNARTCIPDFIDELVRIKWIGRNEHEIWIEKFDRHNGETAKARGLAAKRASKYREKQKAEPSRKSNGKRHAKVAKSELPKEEKRREDITTLSGSNPPTPFPGELDTPKFRDVWSLWEKHRTEIRKKLTPTAVSRQMADLSKMGVERAVAAINFSIANGYTGIFEPKNNGPAQRDRTETEIDAAGDEWLRQRREAGL